MRPQVILPVHEQENNSSSNRSFLWNIAFGVSIVLLIGVIVTLVVLAILNLPSISLFITTGVGASLLLLAGLGLCTTYPKSISHSLKQDKAVCMSITESVPEQSPYKPLHAPYIQPNADNNLAPVNTHTTVEIA